jgi:putative ABC transport system substrate-binding protein
MRLPRAGAGGESMPRRILALLLSVLAVAVLPGLSRDSEAQTPVRVFRIGYLETGARPSNPARYAERFREELGALGYVEGRHYVMEYRFSEGQRDRLPDLAVELVQMPVDLVLAASTSAALAAKQATTTIPVVFTVSADPVERGLVQSLGRPGGNVTGFTNGIHEEKRLKVLKEAVPAMKRCGWLCECPSKTIPDVARPIGVDIHFLLATGPQDFGRAFAEAKKAGVDGVVVTDEPWTNDAALQQAAELTMAHRIPAIGPFPKFAEFGGLLYYGPRRGQAAVRAAAMADRILKGTRPADIPVEQPTQFELIVNLRTARHLGVTIPDAFLARADRVIE